ncbi:IclR family transcriptional regulator [Paraburkholderia youngii]|uniref:IclR family transcriptional regulator n=1 Tax=Paraburkholderia youngii TaxID=2782701 RepID=UPI003D1A4368
MNTISDSTDGGSLRRGVVLLKTLASAASRGLALTDLAGRTGIPHPTVHRVLHQLIKENLVTHDQENKRYKLGPVVFELGLACSTMYDLRDLCCADMEALADVTGDTVYFTIRSGFEAVCVHRCEGSFPVRALPVEIGSRRPLGVGAGGLAILAALDPAERSTIIARLAPSLSAFGKLDAMALTVACERAVAEERAVIRNKVTLGITAIGKPFRNTFGHPIGALSVAALTERMTEQHMIQIEHALTRAIKSVELKFLAVTRT